MDVFVCRVRFLVVVPHRMRIACDRGARAAMLLPLQRQCALQCMLAGTQRRRLTEWVLSVPNVRGPSTGRVGRLSACQARAALAHTPSIFRWSFFFYYSPVFLPQDPNSPTFEAQSKNGVIRLARGEPNAYALADSLCYNTQPAPPPGDVWPPQQSGARRPPAASNPWMLRPHFGGWRLVILPSGRHSSSFQGRCRGRVRSWWWGWRPAFRALPRTLFMTGIKEVQRSPVLECILAMDIDSTMELPSEPDPGFAGSSSCVHNTWEHMGVCSALGELQLQCSYPMSAAYPRPAASVASDLRERVSVQNA